jgi:hypothetical protein
MPNPGAFAEFERELIVERKVNYPRQPPIRLCNETVQQWSVDDFLDAHCTANRLGVDFLFTDHDLAMTFMDVADASQNEETVRPNHDNALKAYDAVVHYLGKLTPDAGQRQIIDAKLAF